MPTEDIPSICKVKHYGVQKLQEINEEHGVCESTDEYPSTGCDGLCSSSVRAKLGESIFTPTCQCCQPSTAQRMNVTMRCSDGYQYNTVYHEITACQCRVETCTARYDTSKIDISNAAGANIKDKRSIFENIDTNMTERKRRDLLNDLARMHVSKKKK